MKKTWDDNFYDEENKKWYSEPQNEKGEKLKRGFVKFIMEPICILTRAIANNDQQTYQNMLEKLKINLTQ